MKNGDDLDKPKIISISLPTYMVQKVQRKIERDLATWEKELREDPGPDRKRPTVSGLIFELLEERDKQGLL